MYRVRYLEQNDKMSQQVHLSMFEQVYPRELLRACAQQSVMASPKARRVRHFTALSVLWFVLAMVLWSRTAQGRVWDKLTHWLQDRDPQRPQEPAGASALSYQRERLGVEPVKQIFEQGTHVLCEPETPGAWYRGYRLMALDGSLFNLPDTEANEQAFGRSSNQYGKGAHELRNEQTAQWASVKRNGRWSVKTYPGCSTGRRSKVGAREAQQAYDAREAGGSGNESVRTCSERRAAPRKEPARTGVRMWCQSVLRPIVSAKASGTPKRVIEMEGEPDGAALRARRSAQESRQCARCARERGRAGGG